jgi:hypothetical protein
MRQGVANLARFAVFALFTVALSVIGHPQAMAAQPVMLTLDCTPDTTQLHVSGQVVDAWGDPVVGLNLTVSFAGTTQPVSSDDAGWFEHSFPLPAPGAYTCTAFWVGNSDYNGANASKPVTIQQKKETPLLELSVEPAVGLMGSQVTITGILRTAEWTAIAGATMTLSSDYGDLETKTAVTVADGSFAVVLKLPTKTPPPTKFEVTVTFAGSSQYEPVTKKISAAVTTPTPTPTPTPSGPRTPSGPATATTTAPTGEATDEATGEPIEIDTSSMVLVEVVFMIVAAVGLAALVVLGIIANDRRRLAGGERRGFGTDFGVEDDDETVVMDFQGSSRTTSPLPAPNDAGDGPPDDWFR